MTCRLVSPKPPATAPRECRPRRCPRSPRIPEWREGEKGATHERTHHVRTFTQEPTQSLGPYLSTGGLQARLRTLPPLRKLRSRWVEPRRGVNSTFCGRWAGANASGESRSKQRRIHSAPEFCDTNELTWARSPRIPEWRGGEEGATHERRHHVRTSTEEPTQSLGPYLYTGGLQARL